LFGQKKIYPKDTIYVKYENKKGSKEWNKKFQYNYEGKAGVYFNIEHEKGDMALFYNEECITDTLGIQYLRDYKFSNLKEIDKKETLYYKKRFGGNPWIKNKNAVFQTYLIEVISKEQFVIYPVIWRSQGVID
jgi:hypothetical protein